MKTDLLEAIVKSINVQLEKNHFALRVMYANTQKCFYIMQPIEQVSNSLIAMEVNGKVQFLSLDELLTNLDLITRLQMAES